MWQSLLTAAVRSGGILGNKQPGEEEEEEGTPGREAGVHMEQTAQAGKKQSPISATFAMSPEALLVLTVFCTPPPPPRSELVAALPPLGPGHTGAKARAP